MWEPVSDTAGGLNGGAKGGRTEEDDHQHTGISGKVSNWTHFTLCYNTRKKTPGQKNQHVCESQQFGFIATFHLLRRAEEGAITQPAEERVVQAVPYEEHGLWSSRWRHGDDTRFSKSLGSV